MPERFQIHHSIPPGQPIWIRLSTINGLRTVTIDRQIYFLQIAMQIGQNARMSLIPKIFSGELVGTMITNRTWKLEVGRFHLQKAFLIRNKTKASRPAFTK